MVSDKPEREGGRGEPDNEEGQAGWIQAALRVGVTRRRHALPSWALSTKASPYVARAFSGVMRRS